MIQAFLRRSTQKVQEAIYLGSTEMVEGGRTHFTPEFLLWGLLDQEGSMLRDVLEEAASVDDPVGRLRADLAEQIRGMPGGAQSTDGEEATITFSKSMKTVLDNALQEARVMGERYVSTAALTLALFSDEAGQVAELLQGVGLDHDRVRDVVLELRGLAQ